MYFSCFMQDITLTDKLSLINTDIHCKIVYYYVNLLIDSFLYYCVPDFTSLTGVSIIENRKMTCLFYDNFKVQTEILRNMCFVMNS